MRPDALDINVAVAILACAYAIAWALWIEPRAARRARETAEQRRIGHDQPVDRLGETDAPSVSGRSGHRRAGP